MTPRQREKPSRNREPFPTPAADLLAQLDVVSLADWNNVRLCERALAGDLDAAIAWLSKFGGPEYQSSSL
jgi:hypothetical protein